jgi:hypothetical protein
MRHRRINRVSLLSTSVTSLNCNPSFARRDTLVTSAPFSSSPTAAVVTESISRTSRHAEVVTESISRTSRHAEVVTEAPSRTSRHAEVVTKSIPCTPRRSGITFHARGCSPPGRAKTVQPALGANRITLASRAPAVNSLGSTRRTGHPTRCVVFSCHEK